MRLDISKVEIKVEIMGVPAFEMQYLKFNIQNLKSPFRAWA